MEEGNLVLPIRDVENGYWMHLQEELRVYIRRRDLLLLVENSLWSRKSKCLAY